jgi:peptidyl-prolyl cis-trans isomerase C
VTLNPLSRTTLLLASLAALIAGCSSKPDVLARVAKEDITIAEFNDVARRAGQQYAGLPDSAKTRLLNDLVQRELLIQGALREKMDATPEYAAYRDRLERQVLREALFQKFAGGPFPVSAAEVRTLYDRRATETHARLIFTFTADIASRAAADLARGEGFAVVADRYNLAGTVPPGGDIGWIQAGALMPPLDDTVRTAPLERIIGPIEAPSQGWILLRLEGRRPSHQGTYEQESAQLEEMLRQRKQRLTVLAEVEKLRSQHEVKVLPGAAQAIVGQFRPKDAQAAIHPPPPPGPDARKQEIATYREGKYTLGDAYDDLLNGTNRPNLDVLPSVERWIEAQALERAALAEAKTRRLNDEPDVRRKLKEQLNNYVLDGYYQREVMQRIQVTPEDMAAAYERYKPGFAVLKSARVQSVVLRDSAQAASLAAHAGQVPSLRDAAAAAGAGARVHDEKITFAKPPPIWMQFGGKLSSMQPGELAGPYLVAGGWMIFQLVDKQQSVPPLDSLAAAARAQLQGVAGEAKREQRLQALTDSLRKVIQPVTLYADRLRRLPWPPPAAPPGS